MAFPNKSQLAPTTKGNQQPCPKIPRGTRWAAQTSSQGGEPWVWSLNSRVMFAWDLQSLPLKPGLTNTFLMIPASP